MPRLDISLLGPIQVKLDGVPVTAFEYSKVRALLVYLAVETDRAHRRDALAALLWPEQPESVARHSLREALSKLRQAIHAQESEPPFLSVSRDTIQFNLQSDHGLDVRAFTALLQATREHRHRELDTCRPCMQRMQQAIELYAGDFLADFFLPDSAGFEEWTLFKREWLRRQALDALYHLAEYHRKRAEYDEAARYAQRQVELEPYREEAHRQLMRTLALSGKRSEALAQFETCRRVLAAELGVAPTAETTALYESIRGALAAPDAAMPAPPAAAPAREPERRQLSVLAAELDLLTSDAAPDPEALREAHLTVRHAFDTLIRRHAGSAVAFRPERLLVYFGYPRAHEDDARRAVQTALDIQQSLDALNAQLKPQAASLSVRLAVYTGLVVVEQDSAGAISVTGDAVKEAIQLAQSAAANAIVISPTTHHMVKGYVDWYALPPARLPSGQEVTSYAVLRESSARSRFDVSLQAGLSPLVGRREELQMLLQHWQGARAGAGHVALLDGESGIGKSRLLEAFSERIADEPYARVEWRCSAGAQESALQPVAEWVQHAAHFTAQDTPADKTEKLQSFLLGYGVPLAETMPLLGALLSLPGDERYALRLSPARQRQRTLELLKNLLLRMAAREALLLIVDDLHWSDPSTLELIGLLVESAPRAHLYMLLTARSDSDFLPPWDLGAHATHMSLAPLTREQTERLAISVAREKTLPAPALDQIVLLTDGVPLYIEEITKSVLASGWLVEGPDRYELSGPLPPLAIPTTLRDSLAARLDRHPLAREVAQLGAVIGREFSYELLQVIAPWPELALQKALDQLVNADLLYETQDADGTTTYTFRHALIHEAAYESLLKRTRQHAHQRIASTLIARFPARVERYPERIAHHLSAAGQPREAVAYWLLAGRRARARATDVEAVSHLSRGLLLLETLPDTAERRQRELELLTMLGPALAATRGYASQAVQQVYSRARELCRDAERSADSFTVLWGLWLWYGGQARWRVARELADQLAGLAQELGDTALQLQSHHARWSTLFAQGELAGATASVRQGLALYCRQVPEPLAFSGHDPAVCAHGYAAVLAWLGGDAQQAAEAEQAALALARRLDQPASYASALEKAALLQSLRGDLDAANERTASLIELARDHQLAYWFALGTILRGWVLAQQAHPADGIAQMLAGLDAYRRTGTEEGRPYLLALLADAYGRAAQPLDGLRVLDEAMGAVGATGERWYEAELYRLRGELSLAAGRSAGDCEPDLRHALEIAQRQGAKWFELRAALSLGRLLERQNRIAQAREVLHTHVEALNIHPDSPELLNAQQFLDQISVSPS